MGFRSERTGLLADGTAVTVQATALSYPVTVGVIPGSGCTVSCEYSVDGVTWTGWPNGTVAGASYDVLQGAVKALRFTRTSGSAADSKYVVLPNPR